MNTYQKNQELGKSLLSFKSILVAFSGGVDSSFLLYRAHQVNPANTKAILLLSESLPAFEADAAIQLAADLGVELLTEQIIEANYPELIKNPVNRCYHCKSISFEVIGQKAKELGGMIVLDGTNADDLNDYRPGLQAKAEKKVRSPLAEAGLSKAEIRQLAKEAGLTNWDKPSFPCLNSRIPYGQGITPEKLRQVGEGELFLLQMGFSECRVRHHGEIARIEILPAQMPLAMEHKDKMDQKLKELGFRFVTIDLAGIRSGSLNPVSLNPVTTPKEGQQ